jgi:hypothetical protein
MNLDVPTIGVCLWHEIMRHKERPICGFRGYSEVSGAEGIKIMANFIKMCGFEVNE